MPCLKPLTWSGVLLALAAACAPVALPASPSPPITPPAAAPTPTAAALPASSTEGGPAPTRALPSGVATVPPTEPPVVGEVPADLAAQIQADVEARAGVPAAELRLLRAESVSWPDGSLGCRQLGVFYTQEVVDGYWIVWQTAAGQEFDYRATQSGQFRLCEPALRPAGQPGPTATPASP